ncbi:radical SAM protein [Candidatus Woesearchaeota archaeon]|nr:radical SAM protein [Candidatus Woesearchaeota archaeon]
MAKIGFETLSFEEKEDEVEVAFLKLFLFSIPKHALEVVSRFKINRNSIEFRDIGEDEARARLNILLAKGFESLKNRINGKKTVYVHKNSGIPLVGNIAFGIVDRNTSIIEIKPITVCNLKCIYCSVNDDMRPTDFVVEKEYLVQELKKILDYKQEDGMEIHIGGQAEPLYYADLVNLVKDISRFPSVAEVSIDTNATMLSKKKVDELVDAGMTRFNVSINALDFRLAEKIAGTSYSLKNALEIAEYISKKADLIIAPVWMPGINDEEMPKIIEFAQKLRKKPGHKVMIGIQNFLSYRFGRNPVKQMPWETFRKRLSDLEKKYKEHLILDFKKDFNIKPTKPLPKPFKKGQRIEAEIVCNGRMAGEKIAVSENRTITLPSCTKTGKVKVKITRTKHNIFYGSCL